MHSTTLKSMRIYGKLFPNSHSRYNHLPASTMPPAQNTPVQPCVDTGSTIVIANKCINTDWRHKILHFHRGLVGLNTEEFRSLVACFIPGMFSESEPPSSLESPSVTIAGLMYLAAEVWQTDLPQTLYLCCPPPSYNTNTNTL